MASKQANAKQTPAHNGGQSYKHYNTDTNRFETRTPVVQTQQSSGGSGGGGNINRNVQNNSSPANSQSKSQNANVTNSRKAPGFAGPKASGGGLMEYIDKMLQTGMSPQQGGGMTMQPQHRGPVSGFPTPLPSDLRQSQGEPGQREVEQALESGLSWEHIAAGAAGAAAAVIAQRTLSNLNRSNGPTADAANPASGVGQGPRTVSRPSVPVNNKSNDILSRNGLVQGQPSNNPDIDAQFYEIFGLPAPVRNGMEPRLTPGNSINGPANARETYVPPLANNSAIPGPSQRTKQLGDMDSPNYRENFGYNDLERRAQDIVNRMETYGEYNIDMFMDPSAEPAVAARVGAMLRQMM